MNKISSLITNLSVRRLLECRLLSSKFTTDGKEIPKKKNFENRITLISADNSVSITDLKNAQNLSQKKELRLVKIQDVDSKTRRPVYKLMTNSDYHVEELQKRKEKQSARQNVAVKGQKLLTLSSRISEHDLMTGVKKMLKLLEKQYEVRVVIAGEAGSEGQNLDQIYTVIEKNTKEIGKVVQKRSKGNNLKFQILPSKNSSSNSSDSSNSTEQNQNPNEKGPL